MANDLVIRLTAIDNATKVVGKVNASINKLFRPFDQAKKSTLSFFDAVGKNDLVARPVWGLQVLGNAVGNFSSSFGIAESSVMTGSARMAASLGAIGGPVGGFLAGTAAVAGATTAVGVKMAAMGFDVARTAKTLNVTTGHLQEYRGAAKLAGLETQAMDNSLGALGTTLQDAAVGRNLQVATLLTQMGVSIKRTKDGAVDTVEALREISDVVSRISDQNVARKITDMLGVTELLPLLNQGTAKIDEYIATARRVGMVVDENVIERNKKQADSWNQAKAAVEGMGTSLGNLIAGYVRLDSVANRVTVWADKLTKAQQAKDDAVKAGTRPAGFMAGAWIDYKDWVRNFWGMDKVAPASRAVGGPITKPDGTPVRNDAAGAGRGFIQPPRGIRNNNPGNLNFVGQAGASKEEGPNGRFATFASPELGIMAMAKQLTRYQDKWGADTIEKVIGRWAPASENNTAAYIARVSKEMGRDPSEKLDLHDAATLAPLISSMVRHENGQNPYSSETIGKAIASALKDSGDSAGGDRPINISVHNVPAGMTIKAVRGLGQSSVGLTMQPGGAS